MGSVNVLEHQKWIEFVVKKYVKKSSTHYEDLLQEGMIALLEASKSFDETRGVKFLTYATPAIHQHIQRFLRRSPTVHAPDVWSADKRKHDVPVRSYLASRALSEPEDEGSSVNDKAVQSFLNRPGMHTPAAQETEVFESEKKSLVNQAIERLPMKHQTVIKRAARGDTLTEIAKDMGYVRQRTQQLCAEAIQLIQDELGVERDPDSESFEAA